MNARLVSTAADVIHRAQVNGTVTAAGLAAALDSAQLLQSPETAEQVWADALELGATAVEEMQNTRDDAVNSALGGLPDRVAVEHATARRAAALLRKMAGERRAPGRRETDQPRCVCGDPIQLMDEGDPTSWIHSPGSDTRCLDARSAVPTEVEQLRARVAELEAQAERRRVRLVAAEADLLDIRGALAPSGQPRRVPMELGDRVAPAVEWLLNHVTELEARLAEYERPVDEDPIAYALTDEAPDGFTRLIVPLQALREDEAAEAGGEGQ